MNSSRPAEHLTRSYRLAIQEYLGIRINGKRNPKPLSQARCLTLYTSSDMDIDQIERYIAKKLGILPTKFQKDSATYILKKNMRKATHCFAPGCSQPIRERELHYKVKLSGKDYLIPTCLSCAQKELDAQGLVRVKKRI